MHCILPGFLPLFGWGWCLMYLFNQALWVSLAFPVLTEKPNHSRPQISASLLLLLLVLPWLWWTLTTQGSVLSTCSWDTTYCLLKSLISLLGHQDEYLPCEKDGLHFYFDLGLHSILWVHMTWENFHDPPSPRLTILKLKWPPKEAPQSFLPLPHDLADPFPQRINNELSLMHSFNWKQWIPFNDYSSY